MNLLKMFAYVFWIAYILLNWGHIIYNIWYISTHYGIVYISITVGESLATREFICNGKDGTDFPQLNTILECFEHKETFYKWELGTMLKPHYLINSISRGIGEPKYIIKSCPPKTR